MGMSFNGLWGSTLVLTLMILAWRWHWAGRSLSSSFAREALRAAIYVVVSAYLTEQALLAEHSLPTADSIHGLPVLHGLYLTIHYAFVAWILLGDLFPPVLRLPPIWPMLFLYSSYLYIRLFFLSEQLAIYPVLYAFVLVSMFLDPQIRLFADRGRRHLLAACLLFLLITGLATLFSPVVNESLSAYLQIVCFALLPFWLVNALVDRQAWRAAATWLVVLNGLLLSGLGVVKFILLAQNLGGLPALSYRLYITDIGPNWISHSLVALLPLGIGLFLRTPTSGKWVWGSGAATMFGIVAYTQSDMGFSGWFALALGGGTFGLLLGWPNLVVWLLRHVKSRALIGLVGAIIALSLTVTGAAIARQLNSYSFIARLYDWHVTLYQVANHPWVGSGLGTRHITAQYGNQIQWQEAVRLGRETIPDYLLSQAIWQRQVLNHAHNLFLELAGGVGLPALLAFLWFLWQLGRYSLSALYHANGEARVLIAGCIAGLVAALGWGFIDVMEFSPPFFTTPVWALIGLLLAAPQAWGLETKSLNYHKEEGLPVIEP